MTDDRDFDRDELDAEMRIYKDGGGLAASHLADDEFREAMGLAEEWGGWCRMQGVHEPSDPLRAVIAMAGALSEARRRFDATRDVHAIMTLDAIVRGETHD